jgi:hypothetical protein
LGSWHSHPGTSRKPSQYDSSAAQKIAADPRVGLPEPLILIIAQAAALQNKEQDQAICCYAWSGLERRLIPTNVLSTSVTGKWCI